MTIWFWYFYVGAFITAFHEIKLAYLGHKANKKGLESLSEANQEYLNNNLDAKEKLLEMTSYSVFKLKVLLYVVGMFFWPVMIVFKLFSRFKAD